MEQNMLDSQSEDVDGSLQTSCGLAFDLEDSVQTPLPHEKEDECDTTVKDKENKAEGNEDKTPNPEIGMEFESEEHAYDFYNEYARKVGFSIRKDWKNKNKFGVVTRRKLCCSREGVRKEDKRARNVKHPRDQTRVECKAQMMIVIQPNGKYCIDKFEASHNHLCTPKNAHLLRSQRKAIGVGITPKATFNFITAQVGDMENVGFLTVDCKNYLQSKRMKSMEKGDAGSVLQYLQQKLVEDPGFFYTIQVDVDDQLTNIFWADSQMMIDYHAFGDVVCFDTTYKANNYDRPFAPFVGINHHKQALVFGAALIYDETCDSFQWVFKAFLDAMSDKQPMTILTDQDELMANAISMVMPNTCHRICVWHMHENAVKHLNNIFSGSKSFNEDLSKCMYDYDEEADFIDAWQRMLEKYNLMENLWLQQLFNEREKWALVYGRNTFCADMKSTQRNEVMNSVLRRYLHHSHDLLQFFMQFERAVFDRRKAEAEADFKMTQSTPMLALEVPILVATRNVYTPEIFKLFQEEYGKGMSCIAKVYMEVGTIITYKVYWVKKKREYTVIFDSLHHTVGCNCKMFEFTGILCGHALRVIDHVGLQEVPDRYILKRWRKDAKVETISSGTLTSKGRKTLSCRYRELMRKSMKVSTVAMENSDAFEMAAEGLDNILTKLEDFYNQAASHSGPPFKASHDMSDEANKELKEVHTSDFDESIHFA